MMGASAFHKATKEKRFTLSSWSVFLICLVSLSRVRMKELASSSYLFAFCPHMAESLKIKTPFF